MSVPTWLSQPVPTPSGPPPESDATWARRMVPVVLGMIQRLRASIEAPGDPADEAASQCLLFLAALRDHPKHGRNWLAKHGEDLAAAIAPYFPNVFGARALARPAVDPDQELEGVALASVVESVFPEGVYEGELDRYYGQPPRHLAGGFVVKGRPASTEPARTREPGQGGLL